MGSIYIGGGQRHKKSGGWKWKLSLFFILFFGLIGSALKLTGPMIVEKWINRKGAVADGYAFSIRDVDISLSKGQMVLNDVKIFNPKTNSGLLEAPTLTLHVDWPDLFSQDKKVTVSADKVDLILSKDMTSELQRIQAVVEDRKKDLYFSSVEGRISKLNIIEQKKDQSRTVIELTEVNVKVKEVTLLSINKKTEFSVTSKVANGGKLSLTGKTSEENGTTPWSIHGSLSEVSNDIFNKMAGDKLPFTFNGPRLSAEISARSDHGKVSGEISPDIKKVNLIEEKPGIPTQTIARMLNEDLTFTLPFTLEDELTLQYSDTYKKLKAYRKFPAAAETQEAQEAKVSEVAKPKKSASFWPF